MTPELTALALAFLLQAAQFIIYAIPANRDLGPGYTMSARDQAPARSMSARTARLGRAMDNHFEGLILFTIAVVIVSLSNQSTVLTAACGYVYVAARVLYVPAYAFNWQPGRSIIWAIGFLATVAIVVSALL